MTTKMTSNVKWLQKIISGIQGIKAPEWFVKLMGQVQEAVILAFYSFTKEELDLIKGKIEEVASLDIDGTEKFKMVFDFCRSEFKDKKDRVLNMVINTLYLALYSALKK